MAHGNPKYHHDISKKIQGGSGIKTAKNFKHETLQQTTTHMSQGRSAPCIGDGRPPTFNDGNPYFMGI